MNGKKNEEEKRPADRPSVFQQNSLSKLVEELEKQKEEAKDKKNE